MKKFTTFVVAASALTAASLATAAPASGVYDSIVTAVDFTAVGVGIVGVLAAVAGVIVLWKGGKMIISALRGA